MDKDIDFFDPSIDTATMDTFVQNFSFGTPDIPMDELSGVLIHPSSSASYFDDHVTLAVDSAFTDTHPSSGESWSDDSAPTMVDVPISTTPSSIKVVDAKRSNKDLVLIQTYQSLLEHVQFLETAFALGEKTTSPPETSFPRPHNPSVADALAAVSQTIDQFVKHLRLILHCSPAGASVQPPASQPPTTGSQKPYLRASSVLVILSCHIHILTIYDRILAGVLHHLTNNQEHEGEESSPASDLRLLIGEIAVPLPRSLMQNFCAQLVEEQIRPIEDILGLEGEYRVSSLSSDTGSKGTTKTVAASTRLLRDRHGNSLLQHCIDVTRNSPMMADDFRVVKEIKAKMKALTGRDPAIPY